ncbi:MAG: Lrp/AsnC family transcriptional regulator [Paracoccaceae bacterium]|jgi:Lrp/AsnC family transcriptional regulator
MITLDPIDHRILGQLQRQADQSLDDLGDKVGLSRNATWRRVKRLEDSGILRKRVALLNAEALGLGLTVFVAVRTDRHDAEWAADFAKAVKSFPEILGAYRTSGELDYLIHARVTDVKAYDRLYQRLIAQIDLKDVSASFVMEELKETTELPLP